LSVFLRAAALPAQETKIRVIAFGAHPDDCDIRASGTAALFASSGNAVKFVSVTNGEAGQQKMHGAELAPRPNDYHPDHRYTGVLVQDAAYIVVVPSVMSEAPPLRKIPFSSTMRIDSNGRIPFVRISR
jgi:LmbE family N-acetylglucosaminyl deacetylase